MQPDNPGSVAVGHPVDVASGTLFHEFEDGIWPGQMPLRFGRRYSTALLDDATGMFGQGWASPFEMRLVFDIDGYSMIGPDGEATISFDPGEESLEPGVVLTNFGAFSSLTKEGKRYLVDQWTPDSEEVIRYVFEDAPDRTHGVLVAWERLDGNGLDLEHDAEGRVQRVRQRREGRALRLAYNGQGRVFEVYLETKHDDNKLGRLVFRYDYDEHGRLAGMRDALDHHSAYFYHPDGRMKRELNPGGMNFTFRFDEQGRCIETTGHEEFGLTRLHYDHVGRVTSVTDALGYNTVFQYNERGQVTQTLSPMGATTSTEYDEHGRIGSRIDAAGGATLYEYDERGDRVAVTSPSGATQRYEYDERHRVVRILDPLGNAFTKTYDSTGRVATASLPNGGTWTYRYTQHGDLDSIEDPLGGHRRFGWDDDGNRIRVTDESGATTQFEFDNEGNATARVSPSGGRVTAEFDALNRVKSLHLHGEGGGVRRMKRNVFGQLVEFADETNQVTRWRYSACGLLTEVTKPSGDKIRYEWTNNPGQVAAVVNEGGQRQEYSYDPDGRTISVTDFAGNRTDYEYDPAGRTTAIVSPDGSRATFAHDGDGAVIEVSFGDDAKLAYEHDPLGFLVAVDDGLTRVEFERDSMGRVLVERQGEYEIHSTYDLLGRRTHRRTSLGYDVDFGWNARGNLTQLRWEPAHFVSFEYDAVGHETARTSSRGARISQRYNERGRRIAQDVTSGARTLDARPGSTTWPPHRTYDYDSSGNVTRIEEDAWGTTSYTFDRQNRIARTQHGNGELERFEYDVLDNITGYARATQRNGSHTETRQYDNSRLVGREGVGYDYDLKGRLTERTTETGRTGFEWNAFGQLASAMLEDGKRWTYRYDALGRRISKEGPDGTTLFVWDGDHVVHEIRNAGTESEDTVQWEFHPDGFAPIAKVERGEEYLCVNDLAGSPRDLLRSDGTVVWSSAFYAFGEQRTTRVSEIDCPVRFQGQWHDAETGLHYNRFRYYDPSVGRYISPDPMDINAGTNPYRYAPNPITWIDPLGLTLVCGDLPPGSKVVKDKLPNYIVYEMPNGEKRIRFNADEAMTLQHATPGRNYTTDTLAGINENDKPYVLEGRHRSIGVARYGDVLGEDLGGVPGHPKYLDYEYTSNPQSGGVPVKSLTIDRREGLDMSKAEADKKWEQKFGLGGGSPLDDAPTDVDASPPSFTGDSNSPTNKMWGSNDPDSPTNKMW